MAAPQRLLVIEDDAAIRRGVTDALKHQGYAVLEAGDAKTAMDLATTADCDLVLLDLLLPGGDGLSILKRVREVRPTLPVIVLTARGDEADRVRGLKAGADDYVVKPFSVAELLARVVAVLRRSPQRPVDVSEIRFAGGAGGAGGVSGVVDLLRREVRFADGTRDDLTEREAEVLRYLAVNSGRAIAREELLRSVWRMDPRGVETRTIDMLVARLRAKLRDDGDEPRTLLTVRGKGYTLGGVGGGA